jgi:hypothetical protein
MIIGILQPFRDRVMDCLQKSAPRVSSPVNAQSTISPTVHSADPYNICVHRRAYACIYVKTCFLRCCRQTIGQALARRGPQAGMNIRWHSRCR